jgi:hypothetical protein
MACTYLEGMPSIFQGPPHFAFAVDFGVRSKKQKEEQFKKCTISNTNRPNYECTSNDHLKP